MQFETLPGGERVKLPRPSIDTGMGLERIAAVLQGKHDNYDIDLFRALIRASAEATGVDPDGPHKVSHRVIADHLRASAFLVADGVLPSNEGRGYVLRRIMRRAMRHAQILGARDPLMWRLVPALTREMGQAYPELIRAEALITETLQLEETRFRATLARGLAILEDETRDARRGRQARRRSRLQALRHLRLPARPHPGRPARARPRRRHRRFQRGDGAPARRGAQGLGGLGRGGDRDGLVRPARARRRDRIPGLRDRERRGRRAPRWSATAPRSTALTPGEKGIVILNQTPFYGESGGQVGDVGVMTGRRRPRRGRRRQEEARRPLRPRGRDRRGRRSRVGAALELKVDHAARTAIRANHSATHLLHEALRHGARRSRRAEGLAGLARPAALRHRPSQADHRRRNSTRSRTSPTASCSKRAGRHAPDGHRGGARSRARARCSARNTATRCASCRWARSTAATTGRAPYSVELCGGTHVGAPATSASSRSSAKARWRPASGASRRAPATRRARQLTRRFARLRRSRARSCARPAGEAAERLESAARRQAQARARARRRQAQAGDGRRRRRGRRRCATSPASSSTPAPSPAST